MYKCCNPVLLDFPKQLVSQLQESVRRATEDREAAMKLLLPDTEQKFSSVVTGVGRFLMREQRKRSDTERGGGGARERQEAERRRDRME